MASKDYIKTSQKLKKDFDGFTREKDRLFYTAKTVLRDELIEIDDFERELIQKHESQSRDFFSAIMRIKRQVKEVSKKLTSFADSTKNQGISSDYDQIVSNLHKAADLVNIEILNFKEKSRLEYEDLLKSESLLQSEIEYHSNKFTQWEAEIPKFSKPSTKSITEPQNLPPLKQELLNIDKEISENGGTNLGWDEVDHTEFIKIWNKFKGKVTPAFMQAAFHVLPLHDAEKIDEHVKKYVVWVELNEKKKEILSRWKEEKKKVKINEEPQVFEIKPRPRPQSASEARKKLEDWRVTKEKNKELEEERKKESEMKKKEAENKRKSNIEDKKQKVLEYKERKEFEKERNKIITEYMKKRNTVEVSEEDKKRMKEREDKLVEQKKQRTLANMRKSEEKIRQENLSKMKTQAQWLHVDSKLNQETFAVAARREATEHEKEEEKRAVPNTFGGMLVHRPTRAVPAWRAGL